MWSAAWGGWGSWPCTSTRRLPRWRSSTCPVQPTRRPRLEVAKMNHDAAKQLVAEARRIARQADSWVALSNALSDPQGGVIARYFPDPEHRQEFLRSPEYEELNQL